MQKTLFENENLIKPLNPAFCIGAVSRSTLLLGDCLVESDKIESGSVDLILTDLPYGTMEGQSKTGIYHNGEEKHEWDVIIPTKKIMEVANRILRKNGKMILFAQEPFTRELINKAIPNLPFNYRAIWLKDTLGSFMRSKSALLYKTEDILVFSKTYDTDLNHPVYNYADLVIEYINKPKKQIFEEMGHQGAFHFLLGKNSFQVHLCTEKTYKQMIEMYGINKMNGFVEYDILKKQENEFYKQTQSIFNLWEGGKYKDNVFEYKRDRDNFHPTQKPVLLLEDLIKTFSNEGNLVVDLTMGSGSTGVACKNTNRQFIGIEKDENYYNVAVRRCS